MDRVQITFPKSFFDPEPASQPMSREDIANPFRHLSHIQHMMLAGVEQFQAPVILDMGNGRIRIVEGPVVKTIINGPRRDFYEMNMAEHKNSK